MGGDEIERAYDEVPYPGSSYTSTHPDRMAVLATLLGLTPAPVDRCRVLELGCAAGANLLPMAAELTESEFTGIDLSAGQIEEGRRTIEALGLTNVRLEHLDLMDLGADFGQFDYIVAHGLYSWVPEPVRERLLEVCRRNLAPGGVAFVSYNTYPGWLMLRGVREVMLHHTRDIDDPRERSDEARKLVRFLGEAAVPESGPFGAFLTSYGERLDDQWSLTDQDGGALLRHDELAEVNEPFWFHEFAAAAGRHGLQYLIEADLPSVTPSRLDPEHVEVLRATAGGDLIRIQNLRFTIDDPSALEDEARVAAMEEAKSKGETLAAVAGVSLGAPRSISESGGFSPIRFDNILALGAAEFAADVGTRIETGELEVRVQVQVVYALEE